jgi:hypothetical protein
LLHILLNLQQPGLEWDKRFLSSFKKGGENA